jgi:hypothetical protein
MPNRIQMTTIWWSCVCLMNATMIGCECAKQPAGPSSPLSISSTAETISLVSLAWFRGRESGVESVLVSEAVKAPLDRAMLVTFVPRSSWSFAGLNDGRVILSLDGRLLQSEQRIFDMLSAIPRTDGLQNVVRPKSMEELKVFRRLEVEDYYVSNERGVVKLIPFSK